MNTAATATIRNTTLVNSTQQANVFNLFTSLVTKQMTAGESAFDSILSNLRFESKVTTSAENKGLLYTLLPPVTSLESSAGLATSNITFNLGTVNTTTTNTNTHSNLMF